MAEGEESAKLFLFYCELWSKALGTYPCFTIPIITLDKKAFNTILHSALEIACSTFDE